jgi:hypothetical protein
METLSTIRKINIEARRRGDVYAKGTCSLLVSNGKKKSNAFHLVGDIPFQTGDNVDFLLKDAYQGGPTAALSHCAI